MIDVGKIVEIDGIEGVICFSSFYNDKLYVNICFESKGKSKYEIYEVRNIDGKIAFVLEQDPKILSQLVYEFTMDAINEDMKEGD